MYGLRKERLNSELRRSRRAPRRGVVAVLAAFLMIAIMGVMAFAIDLGYMYAMQAELQRATDAAVLAGVSRLPEGTAEAQSEALEYLVRNPVGTALTFDNHGDDIVAKMALFEQQFSGQVQYNTGSWNATTQQVESTGSVPSALSVTRTYSNLPLFFAPVIGTDTFSISATSVAVFQPRDIALVLDYSGSMNDDSCFGAYSRLTQAAVDANLLQCYQDLGSPVYGTLTFEPAWARVPGVAPTAPDKPQIHVEYRNSQVYVTSTLNLENVVLRFSNNATQTFSGLSSKTGTFKGSGGNNNRQITYAWVKSGNNLSGLGPNYGEQFNFTSSNMNAMVKKAFGLNSVAYPYPSGSWDTYIDYCESSSGQNKDAGYRYKYGYKSLVNYWLDQKPAYNQTPDLWKVSAQPVTALKDAVDVFVEFLAEYPTDDRLAFSLYNASNGNGILESSLTSNFSYVAGLVRQRQAAHYHGYTNIAAGMKTARLHLDAAGRPNAKKMIVLMTDGNANWHNGAYDEAAANQEVINEANLCADPSRRYPVICISLGAFADSSIMEQVSQITNGHHFNVPGGSSIQQLEDGLNDAFAAIAKHRPMQIVK
jgi:Flp pilus assembly protein TadG